MESLPNRIGDYRVVRRLGAGGMGIVYEAFDLKLQRPVAIKVLSRDASQKPDAPIRFLNEARLVAKINHPNVVTIHDVNDDPANYYLVMELVPGGSVSELVSTKGPLPWRVATQTAMEACRGLTAAHGIGVIHRDIKPANLMLTKDGSIKVADFGLAKAVASSSFTTRTGIVLGTPAFMSPEQCRAETLQESADVYSLGATYYYMLTGQAPFPNRDPMQMMFAHCSAPIPNPCVRVPTIPKECAAVIVRAMSKKKTDRYQTAEEFRLALEALLSLEALPIEPPSTEEFPPSVADTTVTQAIPRPVPHKRRWLLAGVLTLVGVLLTSSVIYFALLGNGGLTTTTNPTKPDPPAVTLPTAYLRKTLVGHPGEVRVVRVSPDGSKLGTAGSGPARIWTLPDGAELAKLGTEETYSVAFDANSSTAFTGAVKKLSSWDTSNGSRPLHTEILPNDVFDIHVTDSRLFGALGYGGVGTWERENRAKWSNFKQIPLDQKITEHIIPGPRDMAASVDFDAGVRVYSGLALQEVHRLPPSQNVRSFAFFPSGEEYLVGTGAGVFRWNGNKGNSLEPIQKDIGAVTAVAMSLDGEVIAYSDASHGGFWLALTRTGASKHYPSAGLIRSMTFASNGRMLMTGAAQSGEIKLWDLTYTK